VGCYFLGHNRNTRWNSRYRVVYYISHMDGLRDTTWTGKRLGANRLSYGTAWCTFSFSFQNYLVLKYKSKDSLSLNWLWAISILQCGKSGERRGLHTTGNLPIPWFSDRRNSGHSLQYLSTGQELYYQWYLGYFATASNWAYYSRSFTELRSVRQDTCKWWGRGRQRRRGYLDFRTMSNLFHLVALSLLLTT